jgi:branched-chain amino acid aminotransferase
VSAKHPMGQAPPSMALPEKDWLIRGAQERDVAAVAAGVHELLVELGSVPAARAALEEVVRALLEQPSAGLILVAEGDAGLVGLLAASWQIAIHVPGDYALLQDLWVHPAWRSRAIGAALLEELLARAQERQVTRVEVGLPRESFAGFQKTEAFYLANGFAPLGPRMRRLAS